MTKTATQAASIIESERTPAETVIDTIAETAGVDALELDPIATVIDPDALNAMFRHGDAEVSIEFTYHGYRVSVTGSDTPIVTVTEPGV